MPVVSPSARARPLAMNGKVPALYVDAFGLQLLLGLADPRDLRGWCRSPTAWC